MKFNAFWITNRLFENLEPTDVPNLKGIWDICKNGVKWCVQEGYIDCPSREKGQYLGDFTVSGLAHLYLTGDAEMYKKTLFDFAHSMNYCDGTHSGLRPSCL